MSKPARGSTTISPILSRTKKISSGPTSSASSPLSAIITIISDTLHKLAFHIVDILPLELSDRKTLIKSTATSINSKDISQYSSLLAPIIVDSILFVVDPAYLDPINLHDVRIIKKIDITINDIKLICGLVFDKKDSHSAGGPTRIEDTLNYGHPVPDLTS